MSEEWGRPGMGWGGRPGCPVGTSAPVVVGVIRSACLAAGRPDLPVVASWVVVVLAWSLGPETRDPARRSFPGNIKYRPFGSFVIALALRDYRPPYHPPYWGVSAPQSPWVWGLPPHTPPPPLRGREGGTDNTNYTYLWDGEASAAICLDFKLAADI